MGGDGVSGGSSSPSNTPMSGSPNTEPLRFLIKLLSKLPSNEGLRLLDSLITCLAACLMTTQPLFKTNTISDTPLSLPPPLPVRFSLLEFLINLF